MTDRPSHPGAVEPPAPPGGGGEARRSLEERLGYRFRDPARLERALTHASHAHEHRPAGTNEALAFVGDAVLALVVAEALYRRTPDAGPGPLTQERAGLVSGKSLAAWATALDLGSCLRLGRGEAQQGGAARESILASALEAVVGAVYLDGGLPAARQLVERLAGTGDPTRVVT